MIQRQTRCSWWPLEDDFNDGLKDDVDNHDDGLGDDLGNSLKDVDDGHKDDVYDPDDSSKNLTVDNGLEEIPDSLDDDPDDYGGLGGDETLDDVLGGEETVNDALGGDHQSASGQPMLSVGWAGTGGIWRRKT